MQFLPDSDILILDTQYTLGEAIEKYNWGHSSFSLGVDFASVWRARALYLFHHEPRYSEKQLYRNLEAARGYARRSGNTDLRVYIAEEGSEFSV